MTQSLDLAGGPQDAVPCSSPHSVRRRQSLVALALFLIGLTPACMLALKGMLPSTHEWLRYVLLADYFREAFLAGHVYPRWLPDLCAGYGYPAFVFYQPAVFYVFLVFSFVTREPLPLVWLVLTILAMIGAGGAYLLCRQLAGRIWSLLCAALFILTPYVFVNIYVRGDLSEYMAMMLTPWPFYFLIRLRNGVRSGRRWHTPCAAGLALSLGAVIYSHPVVALFFTPLVAITAFVIAGDLPAERRLAYARETAIGIALALLLSAPYWLTVFQMRGYVNLAIASRGYFDATRHWVAPGQFISRTWGNGPSAPGSAADGMPFQLGLVHLVLAVAGAIVARRQRLIFGAFCCYAAAVALMTPWAWKAWTLPLLRDTQFPWRLLSITAVLQVMLIAGLQRALPRRPWRLTAMTVGLLLIAVLWYRPMFTLYPFNSAREARYSAQSAREDRERMSPGQDHRVHGAYEYLPLAASAYLRNRPPVRRELLTVSGGAVSPLPENGKFRIAFKVSLPGDGAAVINQFYLRGWTVKVDDACVARSALEANLTQDGRMKVNLGPGEHRIIAWYDGPPYAAYRNLAILLIVLAYVIFAIRRRIINHLPDAPAAPGTGDSDLMSRRAGDGERMPQETHGLLQGMAKVVGFRRASVQSLSIARRYVKGVAVAAVLLAILAFYLWTATTNGSPMVFCRGPATSAVILSDEVPVPRRGYIHYGFYNYLSDAFLAGQLSLLIKPSEELLALPDPYDPARNGNCRLHDASLYKGKYYLYFSAVPAVVLFIPFRIIGVGNLPEALGVVIFAFGGFLWSVLLLRELVRRYLPSTPFGLMLIAIACLGLCNGVPFILRRPVVYEVAVTAGYFFIMGSLYFLLTSGFEPQPRLRNFALGALFLGLAIGCRPTYIVALPIPALIWLWGLKTRYQWKWRKAWGELLALAAPIIVCGFLLGLYNYLRFDSWTEFGQRYQLVAGLPMAQLRMSNLRNVLPGLYFYILSPASFDSTFPFFHLRLFYPGALPTGYGPQVEPMAGALPNIPISLLFFLCPFLFRSRRANTLGFFFVIAIFATLGVGLVTLISFLIPSTTMRYHVDFLPPLLLAGLLVWFYIEHSSEGYCSRMLFRVIALVLLSIGFLVDSTLPMLLGGLLVVLSTKQFLTGIHGKTLLRTTAIVLISYGCLFSVAISMTGYYDLFRTGHPAAYRAIERALSPVAMTIRKFWH